MILSIFCAVLVLAFLLDSLGLGRSSRRLPGSDNKQKEGMIKMMPRKQPKCPKTGKVRWPDHEEAERQLALLQFFAGPWHREKRVYQCIHCDGWHFTSQEKWQSNQQNSDGPTNERPKQN